MSILREQLAIFTFRPEFSIGWHPQNHQTLIELQRLSDLDAKKMVSSWNLGRGLSVDLRRELVLRTDNQADGISASRQMNVVLLELRRRALAESPRRKRRNSTRRI